MKAPEQWLDHRRVWRDKPVVRTIYGDFYRRIGEWLVPGRTLELGCGSGNFKEGHPDVTAVDVRPAPWVDVVADAHELPFRDESLSNVVLIDVLHHLAEPRRFLEQVERALVPGGRVVMIEPAVTAASWFFYRFLHPERLDATVHPLAEADERLRDDPYDGNQAIPTVLFGKLRADLERALPRLTVRHQAFLSLFAYPLSGGFRQWTLVPQAAAAPLLKLEDRLLPVVGRWAAFRMLVVVERTA